MGTQLQNKVSIIIPHYNHYSILDECLKSLKNILYENIEIITVDNNSTDDSFLLLNENYKHSKKHVYEKKMFFASPSFFVVSFSMFFFGISQGKLC